MIDRQIMGWMQGELTPRHHVSLGQSSLFPADLPAFEVQARVSRDDMRRWHRRGWLSFDPDQVALFEDGHWFEVRFVASLARSGLTDAWVAHLLSLLDRPYCYHPELMFYSFTRDTWIRLPPRPDPGVLHEDVDRYIVGLAGERLWGRLREIRDAVAAILEGHDEEACDEQRRGKQRRRPDKRREPDSAAPWPSNR